MTATTRYLLAIICLGCFLSEDALAREKTDVVWMKNGDRVTGEMAAISIPEAFRECIEIAPAEALSP